MPYKTIREICAITGTTENALRYYDEKGILSPARKNDTGRHEWLYDANSIRKLKLIILYRRIGLSIDEIRAVIEENEKNMYELLERRLKELRAERELVDDKITLTELLMLIEEMTSDPASGSDRERLTEELIRRCNR